MIRNTPRKNLQSVVRILLLFLLVVPGPVVADGPIDIMVGAAYSFPWNVSALKPGSFGNASIDLINNGTMDGTLYIWVANINETDAFGDGASLGRYMYFGVVNPHLVSTIPLPARIGDFPAAPMTGQYLFISPVHPGETIPLDWTWEFVETGQLQNDAQGDSLRFDINYMLVNGPPPFPTVVPTAPSGGGGGSRSYTFTGSGLVQSQLSENVTPKEGITTLVTTPPNGNPVSSPEMEKNVPFRPDYWFIIIGLLILIIILIVNSRRKYN